LLNQRIRIWKSRLGSFAKDHWFSQSLRRLHREWSCGVLFKLHSWR